jgi:hypothetical protein
MSLDAREGGGVPGAGGFVLRRRANCCAVLRGVARSGDSAEHTETQRHREEKREGCARLALGFVLHFLIRRRASARFGSVWRALARCACLPSPMTPARGRRGGRLGKAWHPEGAAAGVGWRARMVSLPIGPVVRAGDENDPEIAVFGGNIEVFLGADPLRAARHGRAPNCGQDVGLEEVVFGANQFANSRVAKGVRDAAAR